MGAVIQVLFWTLFIIAGAVFVKQARLDEAPVRAAWLALEPHTCEIVGVEASHSTRFEHTREARPPLSSSSSFHHSQRY